MPTNDNGMGGLMMKRDGAAFISLDVVDNKAPLKSNHKSGDGKWCNFVLIKEPWTDKISSELIGIHDLPSGGMGLK